MGKFLVVIIGANYVHPMNVIADIHVLIQRLQEESKNNTYLYCLYSLDDKLGVYIPYCSISRGQYLSSFDHRVVGVSYHVN